MPSDMQSDDSQGILARVDQVLLGGIHHKLVKIIAYTFEALLRQELSFEDGIETEK